MERNRRRTNTNCANCMRTMTCEVYLSTHPVGYSGSLSTELISNSCSTTMCLKRDAIYCIVLEKYRVYRISKTLSGLGGPKNAFIRTLHLLYYYFFLGKNYRVLIR